MESYVMSYSPVQEYSQEIFIQVVTFFNRGIFLDFFYYVLYSTLLICRLSGSTVWENAGIEPVLRIHDILVWIHASD
jgi:hypothetical protein